MKVLILYQGDYGKRFWENIGQHAPAAWEVKGFHYTKKIPTFVEELADFLPQGLPSCDLFISVQEHPAVAEMIPLFIKQIGARAVIAPVDNKVHLSTGLARQLKKKLEQAGVEFLHPMTFCTLSEKMTQNDLILEFLKYFGRPAVEIDLENEKVKEVRVIRDAPCGNTRYVAQHLIGTHQKDAVENSGILHHNHPCMATMVMDPELGDTLMHHAGLQVKLAVDEAIKKP
ncbi:MAG: thymidylate synthase [Deltaproteobacteria bacterium]|nr:thymidylate synthase [Deltaproteobacteria bacterium]